MSFSSKLLQLRVYPLNFFHWLDGLCYFIMWPNNVPIMNFKSGANKMSAALLKQRLKPQKEGH